MKRKVGFFLFLFLMGGGGVSLHAALPQIEKIQLEGLKAVSEVFARGHMNTVEGEPFSLRKIRMDIVALMQTGEFEDVQVFVEKSNRDRVNVIFYFKEFPRIGVIRFEGNEKKKDSKLLEKLLLKTGMPYDPVRWKQGFEEIRKLYEDEGYVQVRLETQEVFKEGENVVDLTLSVNEGIQMKIGNVRIEGIEDFSEKQLLGKMKNVKRGKKYRPEKLEDDLKTLETYMKDQGYLKAAVIGHRVIKEPENGLVDIKINVFEGEPYHLGEVTFEGNSLFTEEQLRNAFMLKKGDLVKKKVWDETLAAMHTLYADEGYIYADLSPEYRYDTDAQRVDVHLRIREGDVAYVQEVKITGNYKTRDYVIRREILTKAGEKFNAEKIRASARSLYNLGFFEEVNPKVEPGEERGKEILVYNVKERKTGSIGLGGGYSSVDKFVGNLKFEEANLFGRGQRLLLEWEFGKRRNSYQISFTEPWLFNTRTSFGFDLFNTTRLLEFWTEKREGGSLRLGRRLNRRWSIFGNYSYELVEISGVTGEFADPNSSQFIPESRDTTSSFTPRVVYDTRDNFFDPTTGWRHQLAIKWAGGILGADNNFYKIVGDFSRWVKVPVEKFVLGGHVQLGFAKGYRANGRFTDVPTFDRFFLGGSDTVRGYRERKIPPVSGGRVLYVFNSELKHPLVGPLRGVIFFDAGGLWGDLKRVRNNLEYGAGFGIRLTIPGTVMAIRLDYGWPIHTQLDEGTAPRSGTLHFNLGDIF